MDLLLKFDDEKAGRIELSGGKGANLSILTRRGFPVPPGFIVASGVYREFIRAGRDRVAAVAGFPFKDPEGLREACARLRRELAALPLPAGLSEEIRAFLKGWDEGQAFSVRSSSTMEDLASAAFAGQHDTYLNCSGSDLILKKIKECWLSLWQDRAVAYRQRQGFDHLEAAMAVVVQQMVRCTVAGVGFSVNPVSGRLDERVFDANFGLGESVVSGEGEVDHFILDRSGKALERRIAAKTRRVVAVPGGTEEREVAGEEASRPCLDEAKLSKLSGLLSEVEASYGFPQDIEWGFEGDRLFLLQARPITTIPPRWTRDESAERFPNVIAPLTWDFVEGGFHRSLDFSLRLMGRPPFNGKWFAMHGHYIYGNQNAVELYARQLQVSIGSLDELRSAIPRLREGFHWVQELPVLWSRDLDYYLLRFGELMGAPLKGEDLKGVWSYVKTVNEHGAQYFLPNIAISLTQGSLHRLLHGLLRLAVGEAEASRLFDALLYCETKTGAINRELFEMALQVRSRPELERLLRDRPSREAVEPGALAAFPDFQDRLARFLRDHGHREVDFDAYQPTWLETPWVVLDNVRLILQMPMDRTPAQKERDLKVRMQQAELELFNRLPEDLRFFFHEILRLARVYTSLDDTEHYQTTRLTLGLRRGLRELGRRLQGLGAVEEPMDVFFARAAELEDAVRRDEPAGWKELGEAIRREKDSYLSDRARTPDWVLGEARREETGGDCLSGIPGSPGSAEGPVFQVLSPEDFARFPKGAVLVARTTNPTWTPLFYSAAAVVTESGGPLSHGAVTAREMQIPAVMSVKGSLSLLKNGRRVRVDGGAGKVYLS